MPDTYNAICAQLLTHEDTTIDESTLEKLKHHSFVVQVDVEKSHIRIYAHKQIRLSFITPVLVNLGFDVISEVPFLYEFEKQKIHIYRFNVEVEDTKQLKTSYKNVCAAIEAYLDGSMSYNSKLFGLILKQNLSLHKVMLLKTFIEYLDQAVLTINFDSFISVLLEYDSIAKLFVSYFMAKFEPRLSNREELLENLSLNIETSIKKVESVNDDRILKLTYELLQHITRTNYFLREDAIAIKIDTANFKQHLRGLQPNIEMFVHSQYLVGCHLRMSKTSRGGLRWSERLKDYREEIKSLMITQEGKNAIIVPNGAKGGFVTRTKVDAKAFESYYRLFINNLLDLVDNKVNDTLVRSEKVIAYDGEDSYFVVAADKGTAMMSDVANALSCERGFWLKDAFASGGSNGYSHKELGITARGALKTTHRFFIEKGIDFYKEPISVIGIGSMNGDVFGNGMLESEQFKLVGAISHKEVFIDPNPSPSNAFAERQRLFHSKDSSWGAYDKSKISKGGGVFKRSAKEIQLSKEIQTLLNSTTKVVNGEELASMLLTAKVDMLFNGGVGTYVKSSEENNLAIGDKQNESVRVDANTLHAYCVCEGGNLGFTQAARIEYAKLGGKIHQDAIDNSAGVNISDHEVNLKILLNLLEEKGIIDAKENQQTLKKLTEQVVNLVLWNNYNQALSISLDEQRSQKMPEPFLKAMEIIESNLPQFKREDFKIPKAKEYHLIFNAKGAMVRPIISSLNLYAKIFVTNILLKSSLIYERFATKYLFKYFPKSFISIYEKELLQHPLKDEIIATMMADKIINFQGVSFIADFNYLGVEKFIKKIKSYLISNQLFGANDIRFEIFRSDYVLESPKQYELLFKLENSLAFSTRWMFKYLKTSQIDASYILEYKNIIFELLGYDLKENIHLSDAQRLEKFYGILDKLKFGVATIHIKEQLSHEFKDIVQTFYLLVEKLQVLSLFDYLHELKTLNEQEELLKVQLKRFIEHMLIVSSIAILRFKRIDEDITKAFENYLLNNKEFDLVCEELTLFLKEDERNIIEATTLINKLLSFHYQ